MVGAPGVLFGLLVWLTVREPVRGRMDAIDPVDEDEAPAKPAKATTHIHLEKGTFWSSMKVMFASRAFAVLFVAQVVLGLANGITATWTPAFMMRVHGADIPWVTNILAPVWGAAGIVGGLAGGFLAAWLVRRTGKREWMVMLPAWAALIAIPLQLVFIFAPGTYLSLAGGSTCAFLLAFKNAPMVAEALDVVPASTRSLAGAMMLIGASVLGQGFGPLFTGMLSDYLSTQMGPVEALRWAFLIAPILGVIGALVLLVNVRTFRESKPIAE